MPVKQTAEGLLADMRRNWPQAVTPVSETMIRVYRLNDLVQDNDRRVLAPHGLTFSEFEVLAALRAAGTPHELSPTDLYGAILVSSGGLTKILRGLEGRGLIVRARHAADRRSMLVRLTATGLALAERSMADVLTSDAGILSRGLSPAEMRCLTGLLTKLLAVVEA